MLRTLRRALLAVFLVIGLYLSAAVIGAVFPGPTAQIAPGGAPVEIGLISGPIHYDFLLPATPETRAAMVVAADAGVPVQNPLVEHFLVGWGSEAFYTTAGTYWDISGRALARAVTGDSSVLRVEVVGALPDGFLYDRLTLSGAQYQALLAAIAESTTDIPILEAGFTETDGFLKAHDRFHILRTCNTWVTQMLRAAGVEAGVWTPTPFSVRLSLWWHG
ncbi:DUF2459 domain-containing protein [Roseobacter sp. HKCCD9010]|uniref:DUF2459 domain-containing protein n=1 Tax=unclassified Roseobacter TaxID=196798 RepID=UPI0014912DCC|nr:MULTISPECIES: DUF2459 domain-containing protein [unclassified Roseobacter]MBF9049962.1 DUF2459 domain-containing protein [Rhodobacterales bacterium HKCCD4356]NNV13499.1 DUF2459 domain-containing protein [Roseobacter sp. HKCCD7357]NNV16332.1 DUF2459 domain-containing protein [Roseobacter sp. HKCCD8768]NNV25792.1 DUF2459 domain-containing protein [Roseobacter sp. HKCCD8192]NNV30048.1 DUF2459 domain-containing protein [Roseobacter sp. HKCCD9061]